MQQLHLLSNGPTAKHLSSPSPKKDSTTTNGVFWLKATTEKPKYRSAMIATATSSPTENVLYPILNLRQEKLP